MTAKWVPVAACALLLAATWPALAQNRPPEPPADAGTARPPVRPDEAVPTDAAPMTGKDAAPGQDTTSRDDDSPADDGSQAGMEAFGPPMPPRWYTLAEDDAAFAACRLALSMLGTRYTVMQAMTDPDNRDCGIARPVEVSEIIPGVELTGQPVMRCETARALGFWTRDFLHPAAALLPGSPRLGALETGPAYSCRDRIGTGQADPEPSEHAFGNAIDIMGFRLAEAEPMPVTPRGGDGDMEESFLRAARGTACLLFTTVLGPGSNAAHENHLHLDLAARNGGWRLCE